MPHDWTTQNLEDAKAGTAIAFTLKHLPGEYVAWRIEGHPNRTWIDDDGDTWTSSDLQQEARSIRLATREEAENAAK